MAGRAEDGTSKPRDIDPRDCDPHNHDPGVFNHRESTMPWHKGTEGMKGMVGGTSSDLLQEEDTDENAPPGCDSSMGMAF